MLVVTNANQVVTFLADGHIMRCTPPVCPSVRQPYLTWMHVNSRTNSEAV